MRSLLIGTSVLLLSACSGGGDEKLEVRNGPQAAHPLTGVIDGQATTVNAAPAATTNEFNQNAEIYRGGFEGALSVITAQ